jgi:hypothetical protein
VGAEAHPADLLRNRDAAERSGEGLFAHVGMEQHPGAEPAAVGRQAVNALEWEEIFTFEQAPHPVEFKIYYSASTSDLGRDPGQYRGRVRS